MPGVGLNGQRFAFHHALLVDAAGELPDGRPFHDVREFKDLLLTDDRPIARNLAKQLVTYATGQPVGFSERSELEQILERTRGSHYGMRSLVHAIIQSSLFQHK